MWYEYRCDTCGNVTEDQRFERLGDVHPGLLCCGLRPTRIVSLPQVAPVAQSYFNYTVGQVVHSSRDFEEKLRIGAEQQSERVGMEHRYTPVYPSESRVYAESTAEHNGADGQRLYPERPSTTRTIIT